MVHYFLENQPEDVRKRAKEHRLSGPEFVGQGCTKRCGSDSYGYYVAEILKPGRLAALVDAECEWVSDWTNGSMTCSMPADLIVKHAAAGSGPSRAFEYVMRYGEKWYWCNVTDGGEIVRMPGHKAGLSWNGAHSYRDPSL